MLRHAAGTLVLGFAIAASADAREARVVAFHEPGFPAVETEAPSRESLSEALSGFDVSFAGVTELRTAGALDQADLLVLPYGSSFPADAWEAIRGYLEGGGNLLTLGGRPLWVPVFADGDGFRAGRATSGYWRLLAAVNAAQVPRQHFTRFAWDPVWGFETKRIRARRVFAVTTLFVANFSAPDGSWRGLGHFVDENGWRIAAPVVRLDFSLVPSGARPRGRGRFVMLNFEMAARGLTFVRTGIWFDRLRLVDSATGAAKESVLRNIEALLVAAGRHGLQVQFTFFSFEPQSLMRSFPAGPAVGRNPYTDPVAVDAEKTFVRSIVSRFKEVPFLSFDLINEPSFSNRLALWRGNQPNRDPTEHAAWNAWLEAHYPGEEALAAAWGARPGALRFGSVPLPEPEDLALTRNGNPEQVRALDYNLFAPDAFSGRVGEMVEALRATGSRQLVAVGQDEGGVRSRRSAATWYSRTSRATARCGSRSSRVGPRFSS